MSLSSRSSGSGSRAASPEEDNGKPRPESPTLSATLKQDRYADLKRRSAHAFTIFANEEREKLMKTHPDLPMGLVTRMMVEKWRTLDNESRKPYFETAYISPSKTKKTTEEFVSGTIPTKKPRIAISYAPSSLSLPQPEQVSCSDSAVEQPSRVVVVQGRLSAPVVEVPKTNNPSVISASIAQALGVTVTTQRTTSAQLPKQLMPHVVRASTLRPKPSSTSIMNAQEITALPVSFASSSGDAHKRSVNNGYGFSSSQQALDMFYLALCEPAFPHPNEPPLTPYPANYCYDAYLRMTSGQHGVM